MKNTVAKRYLLVSCELLQCQWEIIQQSHLNNLNKEWTLKERGIKQNQIHCLNLGKNITQIIDFKYCTMQILLDKSKVKQLYKLTALIAFMLHLLC